MEFVPSVFGFQESSTVAPLIRASEDTTTVGTRVFSSPLIEKLTSADAVNFSALYSIPALREVFSDLTLYPPPTETLTASETAILADALRS